VLVEIVQLTRRTVFQYTVLSFCWHEMMHYLLQVWISWCSFFWHISWCFLDGLWNHCCFLSCLYWIWFHLMDKAVWRIHWLYHWILYEVFFAVPLFSCMSWLCTVAGVTMFHLQIPVESFFKRADDTFLYLSILFFFSS